MLKKVAASCGIAAGIIIAPGAAIAAAYPATWDNGTVPPVTVEVPEYIPSDIVSTIPGVTTGNTPGTAQNVTNWSAPVGNQGVVDSAVSRVGSPYVYGASGPNAFDCSGLTQWAYAQNGKSIPRTSYDQLAQGQRVHGEYQPGDILSFYNGGHVGLYAGNGTFVHAPSSGQSVHVANLNSMPAEYGVRY